MGYLDQYTTPAQYRAFRSYKWLIFIYLRLQNSLIKQQ